MPTSRRNLVLGSCFGLGAALMWGGWAAVSRLAVVSTMDAFDLTALRFLVAGIIMAPLLGRGGPSRDGIGGFGWPRALILSATAGVPYTLLAYAGYMFAPAGHGGVIIPSVVFVVTTVLGIFLLGERLDRRRAVGGAAIVAGIGLIAWQGAAHGDDGAWRGHALFVASGIVWAAYTIAARAWGGGAVRIVAVVSVVSLAAYLPPYLAITGGRILAVPAADLLLQGLYQGVIAGVVALIFFTRSVALLGAGRAAMFAALVPGLSILVAYPVLGEVPSTLALAGTVLVTLGMIAAMTSGVAAARRDLDQSGLANAAARESI